MKNEELQKWAQVAEIIGGVAVVFSLIFVGLEIRQSNEETSLNTRAIQDQTYQGLTQQLNNYRTEVIETGWLELREKLLTEGWEELTRPERTKLLLLRNNLYGIYEMAYYAAKRDVIGEDEWMRFSYATCNAYNTDFERGLWQVSDNSTGNAISNLLTVEFVEYIFENCQ